MTPPRCVCCGEQETGDRVDGLCLKCAEKILTPERKDEVINMLNMMTLRMQLRRMAAKRKVKK